MAEMLKNGVKADKNDSDKVRGEEFKKVAAIEVADEGVKKKIVGGQREETAVETTVVTKNWSREMDREDGGEELGEEKKGERNIEPGFTPN